MNWYQTTYFSQVKGLDREQKRAAESQVQVWRAKSMLPFPDFPTEQREQLRDTLNFAPEGF